MKLSIDLGALSSEGRDTAIKKLKSALHPDAFRGPEDKACANGLFIKLCQAIEQGGDKQAPTRQEVKETTKEDIDAITSAVTVILEKLVKR